VTDQESPDPYPTLDRVALVALAVRQEAELSRKRSAIRGAIAALDDPRRS
jgi:hypothetical protein